MNESDKKFIVVQNAQRVTVPMEEKQAQEEAARRNKILESTGQKVPEIGAPRSSKTSAANGQSTAQKVFAAESQTGTSKKGSV